MKAFFRQHSKTSSMTSSGIADTNHDPSIPATPNEWWLARENAFDTAARVYKKLYRPDSDTSYYSREQDFEEDDEEVPLLSPSSPEWNASWWFWTGERAELWAEHVGSSGWSAIDVDTKTPVPGSETRGNADGQIVNAANDLQGQRDESEDGQESQTEAKSMTTELPRRPKLTIQIPDGTPNYYAKHGPNDYSSCRPHITSEERAEWKQNMF